MSEDRPSVRSVLSTNPRFRDLWLAQFVSLLGDFFNMTALQTLVAGTAPAGGEGRALGALLVCYTAPAILIGPFAGVLVDRFDRRRVMIVCDLVRALIALGLCGLTTADRLPFMYAAVFLLMSFSTFFEPAKSAVMPDLLSREELAPANALYAATWSIAFGIGSALGGVVTSAFGFRAAFAFSAAGSLSCAGLCLIAMHTGGSTIWMTSHTLLQARVPGPMRGRVFAAELTFYTLAMGASYVVTGLAMDGFGAGPRQMVVALACVLLVPGVAWLRLGVVFSRGETGPAGE